MEDKIVHDYAVIKNDPEIAIVVEAMGGVEPAYTFAKQALQALTFPGFLLLLLGGIAYAVGSVLYGLGKRRKWMHSVFHIFVDLGALLQFFCVLFYAI